MFCSVYRGCKISWRKQSRFRPLLLVSVAYIVIVESRGERFLCSSVALLTLAVGVGGALGVRPVWGRAGCARVSRCGRREHIHEPQDPESHSELER